MAKDDTEAEKNGEKAPERPLECSECKKPILYHYTEIVGNQMITTAMCADCPELQKRLHGGQLVVLGQTETSTGMVCGNCGTALEAVRVGAPLGCHVCYEVFDDILIQELASAEKIPTRLATARKSEPVHIGRGPGEVQEMSPALRLLALNEALTETLQREDYEQAAWLRDQIKALTDQAEKIDDGQ